MMKKETSFRDWSDGKGISERKKVEYSDMRNEKRRRFRIQVGKIIPEYTWIPLIFEATLNMLVYSGSRLLTEDWRHFNMELRLDGKIPFLPWTIVIYFGCYVFWVVNYMLSVRQNRERAWRFLSADFLAKLICCFCFLVIPTTNHRPEVGNGTVWDGMMQFLYWIDSPDNLFPSIHCLTSWFCYIGVRGRRDVPKAYRVFSCMFAVAVFISTLTTKQHVLADVLAGAALAELAYWIAGRTSLASFYGRAAGWINRRILGVI